MYYGIARLNGSIQSTANHPRCWLSMTMHETNHLPEHRRFENQHPLRTCQYKVLGVLDIRQGNALCIPALIWTWGRVNPYAFSQFVAGWNRKHGKTVSFMLWHSLNPIHAILQSWARKTNGGNKIWNKNTKSPFCIHESYCQWQFMVCFHSC